MLTVFLDRFGKENDNLTGDVLREINGNHKGGKMITCMCIITGIVLN